MEMKRSKSIMAVLRSKSKPGFIFGIFLMLIGTRIFAQQTPVPKSSATLAKHKTSPTRKISPYQSQLKIWCDALLKIQLSAGADEGGIFCKAHQLVHGRCGDAVYPFLTLFKITGEEKYRTAARKVYAWSEANISQKDGSWLNEAGGKNNWQGVTCFSVIALGEALRHHGDALAVQENIQGRERLRRGADFVWLYHTFETGDINHLLSAAAALALRYKLLGDEKYKVRAEELAHFGLQHFTSNSLIWACGGPL